MWEGNRCSEDEREGVKREGRRRSYEGGKGRKEGRKEGRDGQNMEERIYGKNTLSLSLSLSLSPWFPDNGHSQHMFGLGMNFILRSMGGLKSEGWR